MANIKSANLTIESGDEHLIRRLGKAVVLHWDILSDEAKAAVREQAIHMLDPTPTTQLAQQIDIFIRKHKGGHA